MINYQVGENLIIDHFFIHNLVGYRLVKKTVVSSHFSQ
jgi:hypothetical protein